MQAVHSSRNRAMPWMCLMGGAAQRVLSGILVLLGSNDLRFVAASGEMEGKGFLRPSWEERGLCLKHILKFHSAKCGLVSLHLKGEAAADSGYTNWQ